MGRSASEIISERVLAWPGVTREPHRFGGIAFHCRGREIGHLHGDRLVDIPFPKPVRDELVAAGRAKPHHIYPQSGWVSVDVASSEDVETAIALLRRKYELLAEGETKA